LSSFLASLPPLAAQSGQEGKKLFIRDDYNLLRSRENLPSDIDFDWRRGCEDVEAQRRKTRDARIVVDLVRPRNTAVDSRWSFAPFVELKVGTEEELKKFNHDYDANRKRINDFFESKVKSEGGEGKGREGEGSDGATVRRKCNLM
jgi:hypothetical protein